jgi:nitroreductase
MLHAMEFREVVRRRRMVRSFSSDPLPPELVDRILSHALRAPSAGFSQGWGFLALTDEEDRARFWRNIDLNTEQTPTLTAAPLIVVAMANKQPYLDHYAEAGANGTALEEEQWPAPYWFVDTGMATLMMLLTAVDEGLGACLFAIMPERIAGFRAEFGIPAEYAPVGAVAVGYRHSELAAQQKPLTERRRPSDEVVHRGNWQPAVALA